MPANSSRTLGELAAAARAELRGPAELPIIGIAPIETAREGQITFVARAKLRRHIADTKASAIILAPAHAGERRDGLPLLLCASPYLAYARISRLFARRPRPPAGVHPTAVVGEDAELGPEVSLGAGCVVGARARLGARCALGPNCVVGEDAELGDDCNLAAGVTIEYGVKLGRNVRVQVGAVIGSDGFGFARDERGRWEKIEQLGGVVVEDDVEIGANTMIDRGALGDTVIERGVMIDNVVHVAHNVRLGEDSVVSAGTGFAGSVRVGRRCLIGGGSAVSDHIELHDDTALAFRTTVTRGLRERGVYASTSPCLPQAAWRRNNILLGRLRGLFERVKRLEGAAAARGQAHENAYEKEERP